MDVNKNINISSVYQLNVVKKYIDLFNRMYIDYDCIMQLDADDIDEIAAITAIYISLPVIYRNIHSHVYESITKFVSDKPIKGVLVHDLDELSWCIKNLEDLDIVSDTHIYLHNTQSINTLKMLSDNKVSEAVLEYELSKSEFYKIVDGNKKADIKSCIIVYGRTPMMISDGCVKRTYNRCDKTRNFDDKNYIIDRYNHRFPVITDCNICTNIIYNDRPISLINNMSFVDKLDVDSILINLTVESADEADIVIRAWVLEDEDAIASLKLVDSTTGHLKRGV